MKTVTSKNKLDLKKFTIAKLQNPSLIYGGSVKSDRQDPNCDRGSTQGGECE